MFICVIKKLLLLLITITSFSDVCYASFPVGANLKVKQDTLQSEEIKEYHSSLIKLGVNLNDCRCESCRKSNKSFKKNTMSSSSSGLYILSGLILLGVIILLFSGLIRVYNCIDTGSNCPQSSVGNKKGAPIELLWMSLLILISIGVAFKAYLIQRKNKRLSDK